MSYKIGDKVKIIDNCTLNICEDIKQYLGSIVTISEIANFDEYKIKEDNGRWFWDSCFFSELVTEEIEKDKFWDEIIVKLKKECEV